MFCCGLHPVHPLWSRTAGPLRRKGGVKVEVRASRQVDGAQDKRLIHGEDKISVPLDPCLVSQGIRDCLSQHDPRVLYGMVAVHFHIPFHLYIQVKEPVAREPVQHMVKKRDPCVDLI